VGLEQMDSYVTELVAQRRREPQDDLVTALVQADEAGDRLSDGDPTWRSLMGIFGPETLPLRFPARAVQPVT
jgi:cytochrome P450